MTAKDSFPSIGDFVHSSRTTAGESQVQVAVRSGINVLTYRGMENKTAESSVLSILAVLRYFGVNRVRMILETDSGDIEIERLGK